MTQIVALGFSERSERNRGKAKPKDKPPRREALNEMR